MLAWIIIIGLVAVGECSCELSWRHESHQTMTLECQVPETIACSAVDLLDAEGRLMEKLPAEAASANPAQNDRCRFQYYTASKFTHQYLAIVGNEIVGVDAPLDISKGSLTNSTQFFIVNKETPELLKHIHRLDPLAKVAQLTDKNASIKLSGINNSSVHHDKLNISYGNGTLRVSEHRAYHITQGGTLVFGNDSLQLPDAGYLRITFDGLLTFYE